jgi:hypothetical protein
MKIKKRDVLIFVLGILAFLLFEVIYNWDGSQKSSFIGDGITSGEVFQIKHSLIA